MIEAGEDPMFIARRMIIFAAEDIGNADPRALQVAVAAQQALHVIGLPEGRIPLAQAVTYLATAPKSNASYVAIDAALAEVRQQRRPAGAAAHPQRPDQTDEGTRLPQGLPVRPRPPGRGGHPDAPAGATGRPGILPAEGERLREDDRRATALLGGPARRNDPSGRLGT